MELRVRKKIERVETLYLENGQTVPTPYKVAIAAIVIENPYPSEYLHDLITIADVIAPQVEWNISNDMKLTLGANYKWQDGRSRWNADDCRSCNPYAPFTNYPGTNQAVGQSYGMYGLEPLGRFRAGPIGTAYTENDIFFKLNYKF